MKYKDFYNELLQENLQLSEKVYFKPGILDDRWKSFITEITKGDHTTKIVCDIVANHLKNGTIHKLTKSRMIKTHEYLSDYNKNIFPIRGFSFDNPSNEFFEDVLSHRNAIISEFKKFPKGSDRNLKSDIRKERDSKQFVSTLHILKYINEMLSLLSNRKDEVKTKMYKKVFSSDNQTFDDISSFLEDKENVIGGKDFTKKDIIDLSRKLNTPIVYNKNNVVILDIQSKQEMIEFGQNALWCFTYGSPDDDDVFDNYSTNGHVYLIVDTNQKSDSSDFMYVLIKPIPVSDFVDFYDRINKQQHFKFSYDVKSDNQESNVLYNLTNEPIIDPIYTIYTTVKGDLSVFNLFTFEEE